jgi:GT2 family glycosyltransferase
MDEPMTQDARSARSGRESVVELDLAAEPLEVPAAAGSDTVYVLLRWRGRPVGRVVLDPDCPVDSEAFRHTALEAAAAGIFFAELDAGGTESGLASLRGSRATGVEPGTVSVVVATRNRPDDLETCLAALGETNPPPGEIMVADSASARPEEIARIVVDFGARLVRLGEAGLSLARNAAAREASGSVLAFLDDDCRVDPGWLTALCSGFSDPAVGVVAGQLLPRTLRTEAQRLFLHYSHMDRRGFVPHRFHRDVPESPHWPLDVWRVGSGGNLAARAATFERVGGFRHSLGLGTAARGGEDLFFLWSALNAGETLVYRPDALAWHRHHERLNALRQVMFGYGAGHAAYLRAVRRVGAGRGAVLSYRASFWVDRISRLGRSLLGLSSIPARLVAREMAGSLCGGALGRRAERDMRP